MVVGLRALGTRVGGGDSGSGALGRQKVSGGGDAALVGVARVAAAEVAWGAGKAGWAAGEGIGLDGVGGEGGGGEGGGLGGGLKGDGGGGDGGEGGGGDGGVPATAGAEVVGAAAAG
ncbi:hypothetical protein CYMTET_43774, partial [Cymbomonas tetramitiformis]